MADHVPARTGTATFRAATCGSAKVRTPIGDPRGEAPLCEVILSDRSGVAVVTVSGELDMMTVHGLSAALREAVATPAGLVVVDLSVVTFLSASGLSVLAQTHAHAQAGGQGGGVCG